MMITPTSRGSLFAGIGIASLAWLSLFKLDALAKLLGVSRWVSQDKIFTRVNNNKSITLLFTEICNVLIHGITSPEGVIFALGSTVVNVVFIFIVTPIVMLSKDKVHVSLPKAA